MHPEWWAERARAAAPGIPSPTMVHILRRLRWLVRLAFRPELTGVENLPSTGAYLLVANHSGAIAAAELSSFAICYLDQVGANRRLAAMAHPFAFHFWPISYVVRGLGAIPSTARAVETTLTQGVPVLLFPGGDHEVLRPVWQASRVDFAQRRGFLRLAAKSNVPIVPMGISGSHFTAPILWRSRWILPYLLITPRLVGVKRAPLTVLGLLGAIAIASLPLSPALKLLCAWAWLASPFMLLPWIPWKVRIRIGKSIPAEELFGKGPSEAGLSAAYKRVESEVERLVRS